MTRALALAIAAAPLPAQGFCDDRGTARRAAAIETGPPLRCRGAPDAPAFHLFTPAFDEPVARPGWRLVAARTRPQLLVRYRCTGLWLWPVLPDEVLIWGAVLDVTAEPCPDRAPRRDV